MTYSLDLINAAINYYKTSSCTLRKVANIFQVSKSVIGQWLKELPITRQTNNEHINNNITVDMLNFLRSSLNHNPFQTQIILLNKINNKFGTNISLFIIRKMMNIIGFTKKKVSRKLYNTDLKKHKLSRKLFKKNIKKVNKEDIICIDEVGTTKDTYNNYGYRGYG